MRSCALAFWLPLAAWCQAPVVNAVVNAASYQAGYMAFQGGWATIFGENLAPFAQTANQTPLPSQLAGTSVLVESVPFGFVGPLSAPLLYVSPSQIDFQLPVVSDAPGYLGFQGLVVTTASGASAPFMAPQAPGTSTDPFGIFTADASGCGQAAALNVALDGTASINSSANGATPGAYVSVYGTGLEPGYGIPTAGEPTPLSPLYPTPLTLSASAEFSCAPSASALRRGRTSPGPVSRPGSSARTRLTSSFRRACVKAARCPCRS